MNVEHPEADMRHIVRGVVRRGLKPVPRKTAISLRVEQDVLDWFKAQGPGYQTRINAVLRAFRDASLYSDNSDPPSRQPLIPSADARRHAAGMAIAIPNPQFLLPSVRAANARWQPLPFGPATALALLAGCVASLLLPAFAPTWCAALAIVAGSAGWYGGGIARIAGTLLLGFGLCTLQADRALDAQLPPAMEGKVVEITGRVVELPVREPKRTVRWSICTPPGVVELAASSASGAAPSAPG